MKALFGALLIGLVALPAAAQEPVDPNAYRGDFRFYLAPVAQATEINREAAVVTGVEFGWLVTPRLTLGLASYRLANQIAARQPDLDGDGANHIDFFYAGVTAAYGIEVAPRTRLVGQALIGGGEAHWRSNYWRGMPDPDHRDTNHRTSFVAEPALGVDVQLTPWLRADLRGGYRFVTGGESNVVEQKDLQGVTGTFGLRFGRF